MAEVLATMVVGPLLSMVKEKASSYLLDQYQVMEGLEKQHEVLKRKLPAILDVIADAEEQAASKREGAKAWLEGVRKVAYQANDVLDEFKYEALRRKAREDGHYKKLGMDVIKLFPSHNRFVFRRKMGNKLRLILEELDVLITEMNAFRFKFIPGPPTPVDYLRQNSCEIIDHKNIANTSRAIEKQEVVQALLDKASNVNLTIFPIVGMGGMGKTTLAQLVYNDPMIQEHFQLRLWVCVSDNFDVDSLVKSIIKESKKNGCQVDENSALDKQLQSAVSGKRYLLVLDDVWNRDESHKWEKLKSYLQHGGSGSSVLTTTRDQAVAQLMMGTSKGAYELGRLGEKFIEEIIKSRAFCSKQEKDRPRELVQLVGDVAKRCVGSPLAATALGSVLSTKTSAREWKDVLRRKKICDDRNGILPVLKLSYNCLPSHMRQCFAFCAMFSKDYEIDVEILIQLWMANGFIPEQQGEEHPEILGKNIFIELASRSFFQDVNGIPFEFTDIEVSRVTCKIHDLMHDVALDSMGKECAAIASEQSKSENFPHSARHLLLSINEPETLLNASLEKGSPVIQTLICEKNLNKDLHHLSKYRSARALRIKGGLTSRTMLGLELWSKQASFLKSRCLHHLRYLDLSGSDIMSLPEDISILYHLQTLNLSYCYKLEQLPKGMKYMTALRHLYTHGCFFLKGMPADLKQLTSLQTLTCFVAGVVSGCSKLGELRQLDDLGGKLELKRLENVKEADAKEAKLGNKKKLTRLTLEWSDCDKEAHNSDKEVLERLEPHDGLKVLKIYSCSIETCPTWMNALQGIVELELSDCKRLEKLPAIWQLPALEVLCLHGLLNMGYLCSRETPFTFQKLKQLRFSKMPNFKTWWDTYVVRGEKAVFPLLEKMLIKDCKSLVALPKASVVKEPFGGVETEFRSAFPALRKMELSSLEMFQQWEAGEGTLAEQLIFPLLEKLLIRECKSLTALPKASVIKEPFGGVETKYMSAFPALKEMELKDLEIFLRWEAGEGTLEEQLIFPRLEKLSIRRCKSLAAFPKASVVKPPFGGVEAECGSAFPALRELVLLDMKTLERWEAGKGTPGEELTFPRLEELTIQSCPQLTTLPEAPKLSVLAVRGVNQQIWSLQTASRYITFTSLSSLQLSADDTETESVAEQNSRELVHGKEKWQHISYPLTRMTLRGYNLLFSHSSALTIWTCFAKLVDLKIWECNALVYWPEKVFQALVLLKTLDTSYCYKLTGRTKEASEQSASERSGLLPRLEYLQLWVCPSLVEVPNLPTSLKTLRIYSCHNLGSIVFGQQENTPSSASHPFLPCLESLYIESCHGLSVVANLPPSIKTLYILWCGNLRSLSGQLDALQTLHILGCSKLESLESCLGRHPSLEGLDLENCSSLQSLPNGPQVYSSLRALRIKSCPSIKLLPPSLQQRLDHLEEKKLDARYEGWEYATRMRPACFK